MKKFLLFLSLTTLFGLLSYAEDIYIVAGSPQTIFGSSWDGTDINNRMTEQSDGTFAKSYSVSAATTGIQLKVVQNSTTWIGDESGNNITFNMKAADEFTVTYNPASYKVSVTGANVSFPDQLEYTDIYAVGNGSGAWLNGISWTPSASENKMTKVEDNLYEITFKDVPATTGLEVKFAVDGSWTHNFGGAFSASGETAEAVYNGGNISFSTTETADINLVIDLRNFNFSTKSGATFKITIGEDGGVDGVIADAKKGSGIRYNAIGQRVSKDYRGFVIEDGVKKVIR